MKISPNFSEVKNIAAAGKYNILPISCEILSDFTTPIETMKILKTYQHTAICLNQLIQMINGVDILF